MPPPEIKPATSMERVIAVVLIMVLLGTGFYSKPWLGLLEHSFDGLTALYEGNGHAGNLDLVAH
jgi:NADH:ubiquinone oxidoreductase subunit 4 (subunit M)